MIVFQISRVTEERDTKTDDKYDHNVTRYNPTPNRWHNDLMNMHFDHSSRR